MSIPSSESSEKLARGYGIGLPPLPWILASGFAALGVICLTDVLSPAMGQDALLPLVICVPAVGVFGISTFLAVRSAAARRAALRLRRHEGILFRALQNAVQREGTKRATTTSNPEAASGVAETASDLLDTPQAGGSNDLVENIERLVSDMQRGRYSSTGLSSSKLLRLAAAYRRLAEHVMRSEERAAEERAADQRQTERPPVNG